MSLTEIIVVLDRSGSMANCASDHRGGLNQFIKDQQKLEGDVNFTLVQFDSYSPFELIYDRVPISNVQDIPLEPRGGTPLLDSLGQTIGYVSDELNKTEKKPDQVILMCITDGEENSSKEFTKETITKLIAEKENEKQTNPPWAFLYLGANIDSFGEASKIGYANMGHVANYAQNSLGIDALYSGTSCATIRSRKAVMCSSSNEEITSALCFTDDERAAFQAKPDNVVVSSSNSTWRSK